MQGCVEETEGFPYYNRILSHICTESFPLHNTSKWKNMVYTGWDTMMYIVSGWYCIGALVDKQG